MTIKNFSSPHQKNKQKKFFEPRIQILLTFFLLFAVGIVVRLCFLQIQDHGFYEALALGQHEFYQKLVPVRGQIFMSDKKEQKAIAVATNQELAVIYADPRHIQNPEETAQKLGEIFSYSPEKISSLSERFEKKEDPYEPVEEEVSDKQLEKILDLDLPGISFFRELVRLYPEPFVGGQLLGFIGANDDGSVSGRYGLEGYFDDLLAGTPGFLRSDTDISGRLITVGDRLLESAVNGADLYLTIDRNIQFVVCKKLQESVFKHGADGGSIIIIEPNTGNVLAMCGNPDFDPNNYAQVKDLYQFNNPAIFNAYEPGSVFKPITIAAGLDVGAIEPDTTFVDTGSEVIGGHIIHNSLNKVYGKQTMTQVLQESINTGVIFAMRQMGVGIFTQYVKDFGFGKKTDISLETEVAGDISSLDVPSEIYPATASFGQGITVTPFLQLAMAYAAIANGGKLMKPQILEKIVYPDGSEKKIDPIFIRSVIQEKTAQLIGAMLVSVVEDGHGKRAAVPGYYIAGKTGTAQVPKEDGNGYDLDKTIGTFAGFGPVQNPKFVMVVRIDNPKDVQFAESSSAPLFGEIANYLLQYFQIPPERPI